MKKIIKILSFCFISLSNTQLYGVFAAAIVTQTVGTPHQCEYLCACNSKEAILDYLHRSGELAKAIKDLPYSGLRAVVERAVVGTLTEKATRGGYLGRINISIRESTGVFGNGDFGTVSPGHGFFVILSNKATINGPVGGLMNIFGVGVDPRSIEIAQENAMRDLMAQAITFHLTINHGTIKILERRAL